MKIDPKLIVENEIVDKMEYCESGYNPLALNPMDKDHTPSYGLLQFKPETLISYTNRYGLMNTNGWEISDAMNWAYDGQFVESIFRKMLYDKKVVWTQEFPDCYRRNQSLFNQFFSL